jgi:hypothetical protein
MITLSRRPRQPHLRLLLPPLLLVDDSSHAKAYHMKHQHDEHFNKPRLTPKAAAVSHTYSKVSQVVRPVSQCQEVPDVDLSMEVNHYLFTLPR